MDESSNDFRATLIELIDATAPEAAEHPSADRWLACQRGELAAGEEEALEEHLVRCRDCFDLAQAAAAFADEADEAGAGEASEEDRATAEWQQLRHRLGQPPGHPIPTAGEISAPRPPRLAWRRRFPTALAAALFLALLASTAWNLHQQSALERLRAPRPSAPAFDFFGDERQAPAERTLTAGTGPWMLVFHPGDELPAYRLAIRDAATGRALFSLDLQPDADLALTLELPEGLPAGRYRLELSAGGRVLETHLLRVTETGRGGSRRR